MSMQLFVDSEVRIFSQCMGKMQKVEFPGGNLVDVRFEGAMKHTARSAPCTLRTGDKRE
jgi:hypothetical protein